MSSALGGKLFEKIGPLFRSKKLIHSNLKKAFPNIDLDDLNKTSKLMWNNYGKVLRIAIRDAARQRCKNLKS